MKLFKKFQLQTTTKNRLFLLFMIAYFPLLLCIFIGSIYGEYLLKQQSIKYNHNTISLQLATIDTELNHISNYLASFLLDEDHYKPLLSSHSDEELQESIRSDFTEYLSTYNSSATLFFYLPEQDILILQTANYDTFLERREMKQYIRQTYLSKKVPSGKLDSSGWEVFQGKNQNYLLQVLEYQNAYVGSWEVCRYLFADFQSVEVNTKGTLLLSNQSGIEFPVFSSKDSARPLDPREDYVTIPVPSEKNHYCISLSIPERYVLDAFAWFQYIELALMILTVIILGILIIGTWKQMMEPLLRMIHAMKAVQEGDFDTTLPVPNTRDEFAELTNTFNYMIRQIRTLKIQVYEEKLHQVHSELQYLTLQIKPHFFLNCLNVLYSLGLSGRSALVAEFSSTLMKYFRYLFKSSDSMVSIQQELEHMQNYLHIQKIRFQNDLDCSLSIQKEAEQLQIPVLLIHTFVENIFKHAYRNDTKLQFQIRAECIVEDYRTFLLLSIQDNGKGYPADCLEDLNSLELEALSGDGTHIGIANVKQRLLHIYGEDLYLHFHNLPEGGACITLKLPQNKF